MRRLAVTLWLMMISGGIAAMFWYNEWVYSLPTPVPANYKPVEAGEMVALPAALKPIGRKPLFLHFFNPSCPCSKFNVPYFSSLAKQYGDDARFAVVVMSDKQYTASDIQKKFGVDIPIMPDTALAAACGVYSTPQAVIIDSTGKLYYRGNYNKSRYCTDKKTEYARIALEGLLHKNYNIPYDQFALKAYGCRLPGCEGK
jgi:hypothetical protein